MAFHEILVAATRRFVRRQIRFRDPVHSLEFVVPAADDLKRGRVSQIETVPEIYDGPDHKGFRDFSVRLRRMFLQKLSPRERTIRAIFPEISACPEPVVAVAADVGNHSVT